MRLVLAEAVAGKNMCLGLSSAAPPTTTPAQEQHNQRLFQARVMLLALMLRSCDNAELCLDAATVTVAVAQSLQALFRCGLTRVGERDCESRSVLYASLLKHAQDPNAPSCSRRPCVPCSCSTPCSPLAPSFWRRCCPPAAPSACADALDSSLLSSRT